MESFIMLSYLLVLSNVTQHLLIMSGVELNPGPFSLAPKGSESNRKMRSDAKVNQNREKQQQASGSSQAFLPSYYELATASTIQRPRIDATDRRQIEAQNEDRSHTTKDALDDIKRVHYKEKKKKEQNNSEPHQPTILQYVGRSSTEGNGKNNEDTYAWDPKYGMSLKNTPKNKKYTEGNNPNEMDMSGNKRQMDDEFKTRFFTLGKMEQKTAEAFYSKRIENEFKWPDPNESKDAGSLRKKANSARLRRERVKQKTSDEASAADKKQNIEPADSSDTSGAKAKKKPSKKPKQTCVKTCRPGKRSGCPIQGKGKYNEGHLSCVEVNRRLEALGVNAESASLCVKSAIQKGFIKLKGEDPKELEQFLCSETAQECEHEMKATLGNLLKQPDYAGLDCMDGLQNATVSCGVEGCEEGRAYITSMCEGEFRFDSGKYHHHCTECPGFGRCIYDYRDVHCYGCGGHYFSGMNGFPCSKCEPKRSQEMMDNPGDCSIM